MTGYLYIKQSLRRRFKTHLNMLVLFTCALILPFVFLIYRDSSIEGSRLQAIHLANNSNYKISGLTKEQAEIFLKLERFDASFEDNAVYLKNKYEVDEDKDYLELLPLVQRFNSKKVFLTNLNGLYSSAENNPISFLALVTTVFIIFISLLVIRAAYKAYLNSFTRDIGILRALGASKKQIGKMFLLQLSVIFAIGLLSALIVSCIVMSVLFKLFLGLENVANFVWFVFDVNLLSLAAAAAIIMFFTFVLHVKVFNKFFNATPDKLMKTGVGSGTIKRPKKEIAAAKSAALTISKLLCRRTGRCYKSCFALTAVTLTILICILNSISIGINGANAKSEYDVYVKKMSHLEPSFSKDELSYFNSLPNVKNIKLDINNALGKYLLPAEKELSSRFGTTEVAGKQYILLSIKSEEHLGKPIEKGTVAINKNNAFADFKVGDSFNLYKQSTKIGLSQAAPEKMPSGFIVAELLDDIFSDTSLPVYMNMEDYNALFGNVRPSIIQISFDENADYDTIIAEMASKFDDDISMYGFTDYRLVDRTNAKLNTGISILISFIALILFFFILIILYVLISDFINSQSENIRLFYVTGASKKAIFKAYLWQSGAISAVCLAVSLGAGTFLSTLFFKNTGYYLSLNAFTVISYLSAAAVIAIAFNLPVILGMKKQLGRVSFNA